MRRPWHIWIGFVVALALSLAGMGWVSLTALRLDRAEHRARRVAAREEKVKLALWRIDSSFASCSFASRIESSVSNQRARRSPFSSASVHPVRHWSSKIARRKHPGSVGLSPPRLKLPRFARIKNL